MAEVLRKITLAKIGATIGVLKAAVAQVAEGEVVPAMRVVGVANGYKAGQTDKGEYVTLLGEFQAINLMTGEQFTSSRAIIPTFIAENFVPALQQHGNAEFALDIGARRKDSAVAGYEFIMRPLIESKASDRLSALLEVASKAAPLALAAPKSDSKPAAKPDDKPAAKSPAKRK